MKISLPSNFFHGLSASTSEDPDSFEIHKFVLSANSSPAESSFEGRVPENSQRSAERAWDNSNKIVDGTLAAVRQISTQLDEMNTRIQSIDRMLNSVSSEITEMKKYGQGKASTMENGLRDIDGRIRSIEQVAKKIRAEVEGRDYKDTLANLQGSLKETQSNLLRSLPESISDGMKYPIVENVTNIISCHKIVTPNGLLHFHNNSVPVEHSVDIRVIQEATKLKLQEIPMMVVLMCSSTIV